MSTPRAAGYSARLLIATDDGIQPIIHAALELRAADPAAVLLVLIGADAAFPFKPRPSTILVPEMPPGVIACVPQLDEFGVASRLASALGLPGCYDGSVLELVEQWLQAIEPSLRAQVHVTVSGNEELVSSTEELGRRINVPVGTLENQSCDGGRHP